MKNFENFKIFGTMTIFYTSDNSKFWNFINWMKLQKHVIFNVSNDTYSSVSSLSLYKNNSGTSKTRVPGSISSRWSKNYVRRRIMVDYVYFWEKNDEFRQNKPFKKMRVPWLENDTIATLVFIKIRSEQASFLL